MVTDGGGALVLTSSERAKDLANAGRMVLVPGPGEAAESVLVSQMEDDGSFHAFNRSSAEAFATAGLTRAGIDHLMCCAACAHLPLYEHQDTGFVGRGESGAFIADGNTSSGGSLQMTHDAAGRRSARRRSTDGGGTRPHC